MFLVVPAGHVSVQAPDHSAYGNAHCQHTLDVVPALIWHCVQLLLHEHVFGIVSFVSLLIHVVAVVLYRHLRLKLPVPLVYVPAGHVLEHTPENK